MKVLHTSDWHLGRALHGRKRYEEYNASLNWLAALIESEDIDVLLVAGDVFDNSAPSNHAQELYYRFLCRVAASSNRRVVVTAGNHDSPSFLDAPRDSDNDPACPIPSPGDVRALEELPRRAPAYPAHARAPGLEPGG